MAKRFLCIKDDALEDKIKCSKNQNTEKSEKRAHRAFTKFLIAMGCEEDATDYWNFSERDLDKYLSKFWLGACKDICEDNFDEKDTEMKDRMYKANSLRNFRYGLNHILKSKGHLYDITDKRTASFAKSQQAFQDTIKKLKSEGKGDVDSYPEIEEDGKHFY